MHELAYMARKNKNNGTSTREVLMWVGIILGAGIVGNLISEYIWHKYCEHNGIIKTKIVYLKPEMLKK